MVMMKWELLDILLDRWLIDCLETQESVETHKTNQQRTAPFMQNIHEVHNLKIMYVMHQTRMHGVMLQCRITASMHHYKYKST